MKKFYRLVFMILCCICLGACGNRQEELPEEDRTPGGDVSQEQSIASGSKEEAQEYLDIASQTTQIFDILSEDWKTMFEVNENLSFREPYFLGMQYYQGEPVQLWGVQRLVEGETQLCMDVYLCRADGSCLRLFQNLEKDYIYGQWFLDQEGNAYMCAGESIRKMDAKGNVLFDRETEYMLNQICQISDGSIYALGLGRGGGRYKLVQVEPEAGDITVVDDLKWSSIPVAVGSGENGLIYLDHEGFWEINLQDKTKSYFLKFEGTTYHEDVGKNVTGFRLLEDGSFEILRSDGTLRNAGNSENNIGIGDVETLRLSDVAQGKIPIVMRGFYFNLGWTKDMVTRFNQSQEEYVVILDEWEEGTDWDDFVRRTAVEIATGKGPDIICGEIFEESIYSLVQKGVLEDLKPYMEESGIREEDYFPLAFSSWREGEEIYSILPFIKVESYRIDEAVLGDRRVPDIETLMDALIAYKEDAIYLYNKDSASLLRFFLEGSETLWGMVDWEKGTCDFSGALFEKLLQVSKRYGYNERLHYPAVAQSRFCDHIYLYDSEAEQEKEGMVKSGVLFDDGCYAGARAEFFILSMNANSLHKDGAWEFLKLLIGEDAQTQLMKDKYNTNLPVCKNVFDEAAAEALTHANDKSSGNMKVLIMAYGESITVMERSAADLTEEKIGEMKKELEEAKSYPIRVVPLLNIIDEEAAYYFNGVKSAEEVRSVIENRVRLYLGENN